GDRAVHVAQGQVLIAVVAGRAAQSQESRDGRGRRRNAAAALHGDGLRTGDARLGVVIDRDDLVAGSVVAAVIGDGVGALDGAAAGPAGERAIQVAQGQVLIAVVAGRAAQSQESRDGRGRRRNAAAALHGDGLRTGDARLGVVIDRDDLVAGSVVAAV